MLLLILSAGCGIINITKSGSSASRFDDYSENLSDSRITFAELPQLEAPTFPTEIATAGSGAAVDKELEGALSNFARTNREETYFSGFTILVYSGVDRDLAFKTRNDLYASISDIKAYMQYEQPRYLVKVGKYINRIEALRLFEQIKENFPTARIIQDRFQREMVGNEQDVENVER